MVPLPKEKHGVVNILTLRKTDSAFVVGQISLFLRDDKLGDE